MERKSANWFLKNGCELQNPNKMMLFALYAECRGNPCEGCGCKDTCPAWQILQNEEKQSRRLKFKQKDLPASGETNAQIAKRLGISKRQASKMQRRNEGKNG